MPYDTIKAKADGNVKPKKGKKIQSRRRSIVLRFCS